MFQKFGLQKKNIAPQNTNKCYLVPSIQVLLVLEMGYQSKVSNVIFFPLQCTSALNWLLWHISNANEGPWLSLIITVHGSATDGRQVLHVRDIKHTSLACTAAKKHGKTEKQSGHYKEKTENSMSIKTKFLLSGRGLHATLEWNRGDK